MTMTDYKNYTGYMHPEADMSSLLDARGATKTEILFEETISSNSRAKGYDPIYTLRESEKNGKPSAYKIYMNSSDEREAALKLVGSMRHWRRLCNLKWFMEGIEQVGFEGLKRWREDMQARDNSLAKAKLLEAVQGGDINAAKKLFDETKAPKQRAKPGPDKSKKNDKQDFIDKLHQDVVELGPKDD